jgi:hypothetical protein
MGIQRHANEQSAGRVVSQSDASAVAFDDVAGNGQAKPKTTSRR